MAVPYLDTGQIYTYIFILILPFIFGRLLCLFKPRNYHESALLFRIFSRDLAVPCFPFNGRYCPCKRVKRKLKPVSAWKTEDDANKPKAKTYLWALALTTFRVGCCVKYAFRLLLKRWRGLTRLTTHQAIHLAFQADGGSQSPHVCFDSNSIPIGVDNHASCCLANERHLFKNLRPFRSRCVGGIEGGLEIKGQGTLVLDINDNNRKPHCIKIPNSLYLPDLRMCLLLPQYWTQEARDNYPLLHGTRMENTASNCTLIWGQGAFCMTIPFNASTNTPIFFTSPKTSAYRAFAATFMALEAPFFRRKHVLQVPGSCDLVGHPLSEEKFVAEENINYPPLPAREGENSKEKTVAHRLLRVTHLLPMSSATPPSHLTPLLLLRRPRSTLSWCQTTRRS
jgi:hypothetical protein